MERNGIGWSICKSFALCSRETPTPITQLLSAKCSSGVLTPNQQRRSTEGITAATTTTTTVLQLSGFCPELPGWAGTRKVKPIWIYILSGSGISWVICKSTPHPRQITTPASHHSVFLQASCPSCHPSDPTNSIKSLKVTHTCTTILRLCGFYPGQPGWAGTRRNIHPLTLIVVITEGNMCN